MPLPLPQQAVQPLASQLPFWQPAVSLAQQQPVPLVLASQQLLWQLPRQLLCQLQPFRLQPSWQLLPLQLSSQLQLFRQLPWQLLDVQLPAQLLTAGQLLQL